MQNKKICSAVNEETVKKALDNMPDDRVLYGASLIFDAFGDSTRIKIISALSFGKMCVCDLASILNLTHSAASHQLRILRQTGIVSATKEGKNVYYTLADDHIIEIYNMGIDHIKHIKI